MRPPVCSVADAVATVGDGDCVYLGNFGAQLFAVADELITQRRRELHAVVASGGLLLDRLIGAGVLARATYAHCWSPVGPDPAWHFRRLAQAGDRRVVRHEVSLGDAVGGADRRRLAGAVPPDTRPGRHRLPDRGLAEQDGDHGGHPFGSAPVVRALAPDVAFVHVDLADEWGNGVIRSPVGEALVAAQAARRVVLVAEELADHDRCGRRHHHSWVLVAMVVHHPGAVAPDGAIGRYPRDVPAYRLVRQAAEAGP